MISLLFSVISVTNGFFFLIFSLIVLCLPGKRGLIHYFHAGFFALFGYCLICDSYSRPLYISYAPWLLYINYPADYLLGVLFYFYFRTLFSDRFVLRRKHLILLLPALIVFIAYIPFYSLPPAEKMALFPLGNHAPPGYLRTMSKISESMMYPYLSLYLAVSMIKTSQYLTAKSKVIRGIIIYMAFYIPAFILITIGMLTKRMDIYRIGALYSHLMVYLLAVITLRYPGIFLKIKQEASRHKYFSQTTHKDSDVMERLEDLMRQDQLFRDPDIKLTSLAEGLSLGHKELSRIINSRAGLNFNAYINRFRIEYAKRALLTDKTTSILQVALRSGFNSKSTFNMTFLKQTGVTPSEYRRLNGHKKTSQP